MCIFVCVIFEGGAPGSYENTHNMLVMTHPQAPQNWIETLATADMVVGVGERQRSSEGRVEVEKQENGNIGNKHEFCAGFVS